MEIVNAVVLKEAADDTDHPNIFAYTWYSRPQATNPAYDQVNLHPGLAGSIKSRDSFGIDQRVDLNNYLTPGSVRRFSFDKVENIATRSRKSVFCPQKKGEAEQVQSRLGIGLVQRSIEDINTKD